MEFIRKIYRETDFLMQPIEAYFLYELGKMQSRLPGDFAEVGVYLGGSAKILCETKGDRGFYGFDTFEGMPKPEACDSLVKEKQFKSEFDHVRGYLSAYPNVHLIKGSFPASADPVMGKRFALVHLDADLHSVLKDGLNFFWERMVENGAIVVHDTHFEGTRKAIEEFSKNRILRAFQSPGTQWIVFK